jgi:hypothetical protein|nr:MAG TPA: hypothetical protein [Caudoviricetes sp.]
MNESDYLFVDDLIERIAAAIADGYVKIINKPNNWRKLHGLPMRRRKWLRQ